MKHKVVKEYLRFFLFLMNILDLMLTSFHLPINFIFNCSHIQFLMCRKLCRNSLVAYCWYVRFSHKTFFLCKVKKLSSIHFLQSMNFIFNFAKGMPLPHQQQYWLYFFETMGPLYLLHICSHINVVSSTYLLKYISVALEILFSDILYIIRFIVYQFY